jgi:hypothetical protein
MAPVSESDRRTSEVKAVSWPLISRATKMAKEGNPIPKTADINERGAIVPGPSRAATYISVGRVPAASVVSQSSAKLDSKPLQRMSWALNWHRTAGR